MGKSSQSNMMGPKDISSNISNNLKPSKEEELKMQSDPLAEVLSQGSRELPKVGALKNLPFSAAGKRIDL